MNIDAYIQARMTSTRLPGKMMLPIDGKPIIQHVIDRVRMFNGIRHIRLLIEDYQTDKKLVEIADENNICIICSHNPIDRYIKACEKYEPDWFLRVCGDSPFMNIDYCNDLIQKIIMTQTHGNNNDSYLAYEDKFHKRIPSQSGLVCEAINANYFLSEIEKTREHVTSFLYKDYTIDNYLFLLPESYDKPYTIDTQEDYARLKQLYESGGIAW